MLADIYDEIAASEYGAEKVKIIEEHYKNLKYLNIFLWLTKVLTKVPFYTW